MGTDGYEGMLPRENFEKNDAIWCIIKCDLEKNNVMKIKNKMCKNIFIIIIIHINKTTTIINYTLT